MFELLIVQVAVDIYKEQGIDQMCTPGTLVYFLRVRMCVYVCMYVHVNMYVCIL